MTRQPDLFLPMVATVRCHQALLFAGSGKVSILSCVECGEAMEHTPSGYIACPNGCGKLLEAVTGEPVGMWFEDDVEG